MSASDKVAKKSSNQKEMTIQGGVSNTTKGTVRQGKFRIYEGVAMGAFCLEVATKVE